MDYTGYDFAAIVGAEVEITHNSGHKYSGTLKLVGRQNGAILLYPSDEKKPAYWVVIENIAPGSLTAKIKVEDMSVKQLKRFIKPRRCCREAMLIAEDGVHHSLRDSYGEITYDYDEFDKSFTDYIDCTDWGWKE